VGTSCEDWFPVLNRFRKALVSEPVPGNTGIDSTGLASPMIWRFPNTPNAGYDLHSE